MKMTNRITEYLPRKDVGRKLSYLKGPEDRYVFKYRVGEEHRVIEAVSDLATDESNTFDWFDASVVSYQMGRRLEKELDKMEARQ